MSDYTLADVLKKVSDPNTGREQIEYLPLEALTPDPSNFYSVDGVEQLARNIEVAGLQQPIRVRLIQDNQYQVVSGHRRRAALQQLVEEGNDKFAMVPCIVEEDEASEALRELRLICANSDTRRMTSADINKQAERVEMLLYQLKEEGYEFPGKMRDHVAEACKVSATKLAKLKVIRERLVYEPAKKAYEKGDLSEESAYELARACEEHQKILYDELSKTCWPGAESYAGHRKQMEKIAKLKCDDGSLCANRANMLKETLTSSAYGDGCSLCCRGCVFLYQCANACYKLADVVEKEKKERKAEADKAKAKQAEIDRPEAEFAETVWRRFGEARARAGLTTVEYLTDLGKSWLAKDEKTVARSEKREAGKAKFNAQTSMPDGMPNRYSLRDLIKMADVLGCSIDYLLCRTDAPEVAKVSVRGAEAGDRWISMADTSHIDNGQLAAVKFDSPSPGFTITRLAEWFDGAWTFLGPEHLRIDANALSWYPVPKEE